jgi:hypothetical protein
MLRLMVMRGLAVLAVMTVLLTGCGQAERSSNVDREPDTFTQTWSGPDGQPSERGEGQDRTYELSVRRGPADHCEWQSVTFLDVGWPLGTTIAIAPDQPPWREFVRDPENVLNGSGLPDALDLEAVLPQGSKATGYRSGDVELWLGPDGGEESVYLKGSSWVERWPRAPQPIGCA